VPLLADVVAALEALYDPRRAESWDAVGLVCGDPAQQVRRIHFAVDPVPATVREAIDAGADLLVTHHPLLLRPVHGVPATSYKGRLVHDLIRSDTALFVAHTNADVARPGVSDALATTIGLGDLRPLEPSPAPPQDKVVTFVPEEDAARVVDAMADAGAGVIGDYTRCAWLAGGTGTFRAGPDTRPSVGTPGQVTAVAEVRVEMVAPRGRRAAVLAALRSAHPYEEPAIDVVELAGQPGDQGLGRIGVLPKPLRFVEFVQQVAARLPDGPAGVRGGGDPDRLVRTVAVCGGAGDSLLDQVTRAGVDAFLTADLRHHPAAEHLEAGGPALVDAGHWATEWPWLGDAAARLSAALGEATVETAVSARVTDPWTVWSATGSPDRSSEGVQ
jgi:dinuclear metal center YbgI/SA1388 family protein